MVLGQRRARRVGIQSSSGRQRWGAPLAPGELCAPPGLMGFGDSSAVSLLLGVGGLFAFGDSPPTGAFLVEELGIIS
jgi:hypothetical protein